MSRLPRRWLVPAATIVLLVLGTVAVTVALVLALGDSDESVDPASDDPTSAARVPEVPVVIEEPDAVTEGDVPGVPISLLADPAWVSTAAEATAIPERAFAAYAGASAAVAESHPTCGLGWNTLAAIGQVESEHGTMGGTAIETSGTTGAPIIGVPLDGDGVAEIPDTDGGRLDGDTTWDHAVGPMQFIPSTWTEHGTDGSSDGAADVHNIDDAALTAAHHLCSAGGDLTRPEDWTAAISSYNVGSDYTRRVAEAAARYAEVAMPDR